MTDSSSLSYTINTGDHIIAKCIVSNDEKGAKIYSIESIEIIRD